MSSTPVDIEVFTSSYCQRCKRASTLVQQLLEEEPFSRLNWRQVDVVEEIDHTVALGIVATPAIAIGGRCRFTTLPSAASLRQALQDYLAGRSHE